MRVYLAGPMRGVPQFNFPSFHAAAEKLRSEGHEVFSPAERDDAKYGPDMAAGNPTGDEAVAAIEHGFNLPDALADDLNWLCHADAIALLPGWQHSKGAMAEYRTALALNLRVIIL